MGGRSFRRNGLVSFRGLHEPLPHRQFRRVIVEPVAVSAVRLADGGRLAEGSYLPVAGNWTTGVTALISDFDRRAAYRRSTRRCREPRVLPQGDAVSRRHAAGA